MKVDGAIRLPQKQSDEAKDQANAELARTDLVLAREHVQTQRERAMADRSREIAMKRVQEQGEVAAANAESDSAVLIKCAKRNPRRSAPKRTRSAYVGTSVRNGLVLTERRLYAN